MKKTYKYEDGPRFLINELKSKVTGMRLKKALRVAKTIPCIKIKHGVVYTDL